MKAKILYIYITNCQGQNKVQFRPALSNRIFCNDGNVLYLQSSRIATRHMCLLSSSNAVNATEELNFNCYLIVINKNLKSHMCLVATPLDATMLAFKTICLMDW